jgi:hypothetical protein
MKETKTIEMVPINVAGKQVMVPRSIKVEDLKEAENLPANRSMVLERGLSKKVLKDSDRIKVEEKDHFYDIPDYDVGNEEEGTLILR